MSFMEMPFQQSKHHVGVMDLSTSKKGIPFRLFYPAKVGTAQGSVGWFVRGLSDFIEGYMHFLLPKWRNYAIAKWILYIFAVISSIFMPMAKAFLPRSVLGGQPHSAKKNEYPLVLYSHGLTGTGEENALMLAYWASQGYVVAAIHHCDGSSHRAHPKGGQEILYHHPDYENYDPNFRVEQVERREEELFEMLEFILHDPAFPSSVAEIIDSSRVFAAGFSYGAATVALSVTKRPDQYRACILLDGWFHIEVTSLNSAFDFPPEAHKRGLSIPALFVGSEQFAAMEGLADATNRLIRSNRSEKGSTAFVLEGSRHQNFTDLGYWLPVWILRKIKALGACNYHETHYKILTMTHEFLACHTTNGEIRN